MCSPGPREHVSSRRCASAGTASLRHAFFHPPEPLFFPTGSVRVSASRSYLWAKSAAIPKQSQDGQGAGELDPVAIWVLGDAVAKVGGVEVATAPRFRAPVTNALTGRRPGLRRGRLASARFEKPLEILILEIYQAAKEGSGDRREHL